MIFFLKGIPEEHKNLIERKGWSLNPYVADKKKFTIPIQPEALQLYKTAGIDFSSYKNKTIYEHTYKLNEKCGERDLHAIVFTLEEKEIIGGAIQVEETDPGFSKMIRKKSYITECQ